MFEMVSHTRLAQIDTRHGKLTKECISGTQTKEEFIIYWTTYIG